MISKRSKNKTVILLTLFAFCFTTMFFGPVSSVMAEEWTQVTTINSPVNYYRAGIAQDNYGVNIYLVGGMDSTGHRDSTAVTKYNTTNNTYTKLGDLPIGLERPHVILYNNALYIIGGSYNNATTGDKNSTVYRFDLSNNTWTALGNAPRIPYYSGMAVQGTTAYFYGGQAVEGMMKYDVVSDTWTELSPGPRGLDQFWFSTGFATSDGKVHFYGGRHTPTNTYFNDVVTYDPASGNYSTTEIPAFGDAAMYSRSIVIGSKVIILGGTNGTSLSRVISFNYNTRTWNTEASYPNATSTSGNMLATYNGSVLSFENGKLYGLSLANAVPGNGTWSLVETTNQAANFTKYGIAQDNSYLYLVGGEDRFGGTYLKDVNRYDPVSKTFTRMPDLPVGLERGVSACVKDGYLYVFGGSKYGGLNLNVYRLSLTNDTWEDLGAVSQFYSQAGMVVQGNYAYFFGGVNSYEALLRYDFTSNTWANLGSNPRGLMSLWQSSGFATPDGKIHFYGGGTGPTDSDTFYNDVVTYDPANGSFSMSSIPAVGTPKRRARAAQVGSRIYLVGGLIGTVQTDEVVSYDNNSGTWTQEPSLPVAGSAGTAVFGNSILAYVDGQIYQFNSDGTGSGGSIMQAVIQGQSAAYFTPAVINPSQVTLDGSDGVRATYTTSPWMVTDARGTGAGWYSTMTASTPTSSDGRTVGLNNLKLTVSNVNKAADALTSTNPAMLQYANGVTLESPKTMIAAPANQGMGSFKFTPSLEFSIPASSYAGEYTSTVSATFYETAPLI